MKYRFSKNKRWEMFWKCIEYTVLGLILLLIFINIFNLADWFWNR